MFVFKYGGMPMAEPRIASAVRARVMPALKDLKPAHRSTERTLLAQ